MTYKHKNIKTKNDLVLVIPYIKERLASIEYVLPTHSVNFFGNNYDYRDVESALGSLDRMLEDYIIHNRLLLSRVLNYIKRLYIVSSLDVNSKEEFNKELEELYEMAMYIKINGENENEMEYL